ncbi:restriction endonuclease subunit S [Micromonospora sp. NPDC051543]|uniref:restriction endonuclease subunit S n=1 Tax=Micromonospora sp. NPDC051543 TaxID=3364287 RepID=UPI0037AD899D
MNAQTATIPQDWQVKTLAELGGQVTSGSRGWAAYYADHGSLFVRITNLDRSNIHLDLTNMRFVQIDLNDAEARRTRLATGDLLVSITADIGIVGYVDDQVPQPAYINQHIARIRLDPRLVDSRFVAYYLASWESQRRFVGSTDTGAKAGVNLATVAALSTLVPPLAEQSRIAKTLADADAHIAALERMIAKKQAIKQSVMQQLLTGRTRLPGFQAEWATAPLKEFLPLQRGFDLPTTQVRPGPYPVVYSNGVARHHAKAMVSGPGVVTGRSGTIGKVHYVEQDYWPHNTSLWVTSFTRVEALFAYYFLSYLGLKRFASGSGVPTFNRNDAHSFPVSLPMDRGEQAAIADVLRGADTELSALTKRLAKARELKQGMMQQLLTGRTRLPAKESAA